MHAHCKGARWLSVSKRKQQELPHPISHRILDVQKCIRAASVAVTVAWMLQHAGDALAVADRRYRLCARQDSPSKCASPVSTVSAAAASPVSYASTMPVSGDSAWMGSALAITRFCSRATVNATKMAKQPTFLQCRAVHAASAVHALHTTLRHARACVAALGTHHTVGTIQLMGLQFSWPPKKMVRNSRTP